MQSLMVVFLCLLLGFVVGGQQQASVERFRTSFTFSPIIGGPRLLRIHVSTVITDTVTKDSVVLDFIPHYTSATADEMMQKNKRLLQGLSIPGIHRMRLVNGGGGAPSSSDSELTLLAESILKASSEDSALNLFSNNCYHFSFRCWRAASKRK